ncbi:hypothetical protein JJJ17_16930 [Paracoccus caeni]|uniref:Capsule polysaccharide biosynthesis protein n=1 Tax=Paracoccus caeni TaxID=657651 RepID=A0A934SGV9_9RHOB|nr:hypothetical protein [Paracoccus caeni]MBK4217617.1 hypothetical protein [Paracoccus caeni]
MSHARELRIYLTASVLQTARAGKLRFLNRLRDLLEAQGWQTEILPSTPEARSRAPNLPGYALYHREKPTHPAAMTFRLAYHYPFWRLETQAERWRWPVAEAAFTLGDPAAAQDFASKLRSRVLPGPAPQNGSYALVPLQGRLLQCRSFQTMSPIEMVETVARTGRPTIATLHPNERYGDAARKSLAMLAARYPNLIIGKDTAKLLRNCAFVATQNSAVAFDGYLLQKPAILFAQSDFHHIALNVAQVGADQALALAQDHRPDFDGYLDWFLRGTSIDMMAGDANDRLLRAMRAGGWPV